MLCGGDFNANVKDNDSQQQQHVVYILHIHKALIIYAYYQNNRLK